MMHRISLTEANRLMAREHYLGPCSSAVSVDCFGWYEGERLMAAAIYASPHAPRIPDTYRDLRRLAKRQEMTATLSKFLASTLKALRNDWDCAITWADQGAGHHGGIYQATNWVYLEPESYNWNSSYILPDGTMKDHRWVFKELGTTAKEKVAVLRPEWVPTLPKMKLRYVYPMRSSLGQVTAQLRAAVLPYPKPGTTNQEIVRTDRRQKEGRTEARPEITALASTCQD